MYNVNNIVIFCHTSEQLNAINGIIAMAICVHAQFNFPRMRLQKTQA